MKRLLLITSFIFAGVFGAIGQDLQDLPRPQSTASVAGDAIQQGNWMVGASVGNIGFNFKSDRFDIEIDPRAGYFVSDNAAIGAEVQLGFSSYDGGEDFRYGITPFARYYFPEGAAPTHRWFGEILAGIGGSSTKDSEDDSSVSAVYGLRAGYAHFVASNIALEGTLGYVRSHADIEVDESSAGLAVAVGFQIYLPGR
ncbi:hypothetical protein ACFSKU_08530 [Pontibacter silvestris]|uniref:Outer membrane protein beta-barrel domain-containing protein n=1 Tax=Pontibacter silvestris TaxID=2305183 RepID=A0ABW4WX09_9BACT|nr:hypothetical protein [Pontibacter silvestris]MCC9137423.1 hypothetical protein [Pontibacter silvestris]